MNLNGTHALVIGMQKSGMAAAELLLRHGAVVHAMDLKPLDELPEAGALLARLNIPFTQQPVGQVSGLPSAHLIVLSPDVPAGLPFLQEARRRGARVIGEVELAAPFLKGRTI